MKAGMKVIPVRTRLFVEREDLALFILQHIPRLAEGSILAITSKIVALAEGRTADPAARERTIRRESEWARKTKHVWLTLKDGMLLANAGIDESNAGGRLVLLPKDSFAAAAALRRSLRRHYRVRKLGILITDSRVMPLRAGVTAVAVGYAGFRGVRDYRGSKDLFGRIMRFAQTNVADSLATAAALVMGEGNERMPLAIIEGAPVRYTQRVDAGEVRIAPQDDMYQPVLRTSGARKK